MTTETKVKQLEKVFNRKARGGSQEIVTRHISYNDGRLVDEEGYRLSDEEIKRIEKENKEVISRGGLIIELTWYGESKTREEELPPVGIETT